MCVVKSDRPHQLAHMYLPTSSGVRPSSMEYSSFVEIRGEPRAKALSANRHAASTCVCSKVVSM
jgi:hypothetical protein